MKGGRGGKEVGGLFPGYICWVRLRDSRVHV